MKETHMKDGKRMDDKEMKNLERSLDGVGKYLGRIEKLFGLHVSVHTPNVYLVTYLESFYKYNCHLLPYCMLIKSDRKRWKRCMACQRMVTAKFCGLGDTRPTAKIRGRRRDGSSKAFRTDMTRRSRGSRTGFPTRSCCATC